MIENIVDRLLDNDDLTDIKTSTEENWEYFYGKRSFKYSIYNKKNKKYTKNFVSSTNEIKNYIYNFLGNFNIAFWRDADDVTKVFAPDVLQKVLLDLFVAGVSLFNIKKNQFVKSDEQLASGRNVYPLKFRESFAKAGDPLISRSVKKAYRDIALANELKTNFAISQNNDKFFIFGVSRELEPEDEAIIAMNSTLALSSNEDGQNPTVSNMGAGVSVSDFIAHAADARETIKKELGEFTPQAIKIWQDSFNSELLGLLRILSGDENYDNKIIFEKEIKDWGMLGDAILKINEAAPNFFGSSQLRELLGVDGNDVPEPIVISE